MIDSFQIVSMRGGVVANKTRLVASSISLCTASWVVAGDIESAQAEELLHPKGKDWEKELVAQDAFYQYLNPIASVEEGIVATETEQKPLTYTVKKGDTLYRIGQLYNMNHQNLADYNQITNPQRLGIGQKLKIPLMQKWIRIKEGETLEELLDRYKTNEQVLKELNPELSFTESLYVGQVLAVPSPINVTKVSPKKKKESQVESVSAPKVNTAGFAWPVTGRITSPFGMRRGRMHTGIDISNNNREKNVIRAAQAGTVIRAGYAGNYGNLVVVDHGNGWTTYYAHLNRITVSKGQKLGKGGALGYMGSTGNSTGVHLHFEVRHHDQPINPLKVLP